MAGPAARARRREHRPRQGRPCSGDRDAAIRFAARTTKVSDLNYTDPDLEPLRGDSA